MGAEPAVAPSGHEEHLLKEAFTTALYTAICLLAALAAVHEPSTIPIAGLIWGTTVGLAAAHWFAFRLSAQFVAGGRFHRRDAEAALAQLLGAVLVAVIVTVPVIAFPASVDLEVARLVLSLFIGAVAFAVARSGGATLGRSTLYAVAMLLGATAVALVKNVLTSH